jgi:uncharacterized membrane protein (UPF0182 family)
VPTNRSNLASFIAVNSDATSDDYGNIRILRLPDSTQVQGPSQIANTFAADERIQTRLLPIKQNSEIRYGNLLTLPVGGGLLYVQPVYALRESGQGAYPVLQFVLASFGRNAGYGTSLTAALNDVLAEGAITGEDTGVQGEEEEPPGTDGPGTGDPGAETPPDVLDLLVQADQKYAEAQAALEDGNTVKWARAMREAEALVQEALVLAQTPEPTGGGGAGGGGNGGGNGGGGAAE